MDRTRLTIALLIALICFSQTVASAHFVSHTFEGHIQHDDCHHDITAGFDHGEAFHSSAVTCSDHQHTNYSHPDVKESESVFADCLICDLFVNMGGLHLDRLPMLPAPTQEKLEVRVVGVSTFGPDLGNHHIRGPPTGS